MWATAAVTLSVRAAALSSGHRVLRLNAAVTSPADPPVRSAHSALSEADAVAFAALGDACVDSLRDKRQIDEVVAQFAYSGTLSIVRGDGAVEYAGQGAVKRGLGRLLHTGCVELRFNAAAAGRDGAVQSVLELRNADASPLEFKVTATFDSKRAVSSLVVDGSGSVAASTWLTELQQPTKLENGGPRWETDDGRVRQQIWQHQGSFAPGNRFVCDTLEVNTGRLICVVDATVWALYREKLEAWATSVDLVLDPIIAPGNEDEKTMENMLFMLDELKRVDPLRRSEPVLAIGGGVLTDTAGFACALWRRGVPWARMPTTLLGMVDASVGIKVAVNYHRKNGVGHFYSPIHTFIDQDFLPTVTLPDIRSGCGEIMKAALVHDRNLFDLMETHGARLIESRFVDDAVADEIIKRSVDTMLECIGPDLWEESLLRPMDFGHSFSRTLETVEDFKLRHGEAVAIDCIMSTMIAHVKGFVSDADAQRVLNLYAKLGLPCSIKGITAETFKRATREITVHRDGILRAPLPLGIGECAYANEITDEEIDAAFAELSTFIDAHPAVCWDPSRSFAA